MNFGKRETTSLLRMDEFPKKKTMGYIEIDSEISKLENGNIPISKTFPFFL